MTKGDIGVETYLVARHTRHGLRAVAAVRCGCLPRPVRFAESKERRMLLTRAWAWGRPDLGWLGVRVGGGEPENLAPKGSFHYCVECHNERSRRALPG